MKKYFLLLALVSTLTACSRPESPLIPDFSNSNPLYSSAADEYKVQFRALYRSQLTQLNELTESGIKAEIRKTTSYLFGPLNYRSWAAPQKNESIDVLLNEAYLENNRVIVPYIYHGTWLMRRAVTTTDKIKIPYPYSEFDLKTTAWKSCGDSEPAHQTWSFFWYFWEPSRRGCDHQLGVQYQEITVQLLQLTQQTKQSYPEYKRMVRQENGENVYSMTFAFGYVEDKTTPNPFKDYDYGALEFQSFHSFLEKTLSPLGFTQTPITQKQFGGHGTGHIGTEFLGQIDNLKVRISVVAAAGVDQMDLFTYSYASRHDGFFGWFGHSRVGSGFDADRVRQLLTVYPQKYSITSDYQLIYWAGCNSYSYYTLPFFQMKAELDPVNDPQGTKNLDLISNGLPSLFSFNSANAQIVFDALFNFNQASSYQSIVDSIENYAQDSGYPVLVNVLGDEDNPSENP